MARVINLLMARENRGTSHRFKGFGQAQLSVGEGNCQTCVKQWKRRLVFPTTMGGTHVSPESPPARHHQVLPRVPKKGQIPKNDTPGHPLPLKNQGTQPNPLQMGKGVFQHWSLGNWPILKKRVTQFFMCGLFGQPDHL